MSPSSTHSYDVGGQHVDLGDRVLGSASGTEPVGTRAGSPPRRSARGPASGWLARPGPSGRDAQRRSLPFALGIIRSRTGNGANSPGLEIVSQPGEERSAAPNTMERGRTPSTPADRAPRLPRTRSHATMRKAGSATRLNRSSNRRSGSSVAHWCSLVWISSTRTSASIEVRPRRVGVHRRPPGIPAPAAANSLGPFAMCTAFPCSDYYGPSAPSRGHQPTVGLPADQPWLAAGKGDPETVPTFTMYRSTGSVPSSSPAASPRLRRRPSPWPPHRPHVSGFGVASPCDGSTRTAARPTSTRLEPVPRLRGFNHWFTPLHLSVSLAGPGRLAVPTRPVVVRAASHPPPHLQGQAALSFTGLLRQPEGGPHRDTWRLVAHPRS